MNYELRLGERLEIMIGENRCACDVQEITEDGLLILSAPTYRGMMVPLLPGELLHVLYYRQSGMFSFIARLVRRFQEQELDLIELDLKSPISKYQRRDFVRLSTVLPVTLRLIAAPERLVDRTVDEVLRLIYDQRYVGIPRPLLEGEEVYKCYTLDLSGGGAQFSTNESFENGSLMECTFHTGSGDLTVDGQIVRVDVNRNESPQYRMGVHFVNIDERIRRKIIKFIFEEQARGHQKE